MFEDFAGAFDGFPEALIPEYRCISCLKAGEGTATYLAEAADTGRRVIVKTSGDAEGAALLRNEQRLLSFIAQSGCAEAAIFPRVIAFFDSDSRCALVREFIPGQSIEARVESQAACPGMPRDEALDCAISLLELLVFLHGLNPPVIHRDIKPQNVIIDPQGRCHLIDLGISRLEHDSNDADTRIMGTRLTAPPEQFGFRQTDARSDIYSAGILLRYCLTGEYGEAADAQLSGDIRRIVRRATQFDPALRYRSAGDMLSALRRTRRKGPRRPRAAVALALTAALCVGLCLLRVFLPVPGSFDWKGIYHFQEPLIEQAVRTQLGIESRGLTREDLAQVDALHIFGRLIYESDEEFLFQGQYTLPWNSAREDSWMEEGCIRSLRDIAAMPNLSALSLYRQSIEDISALRDTGIAHLGLGLNPLDDISPLADNPNILSLNLTCLNIGRTSVLATLPNLRALDISGTPLQDLRGLEALPLRSLSLHNVSPSSFEPIASMHALEALSVDKMDYDLLDALRQIHIKDLIISSSVNFPMRELESLRDLERLLFRAREPMRLDEAPLHFPRLQSLDLRRVTASSLNCLSGLTELEELSIFEFDCESCAGLEGLSALRQIICSPEQAIMLREEYPEAAWTLLH